VCASWRGSTAAEFTVGKPTCVCNAGSTTEQCAA
jgi:hypothetical protein